MVFAIKKVTFSCSISAKGGERRGRHSRRGSGRHSEEGTKIERDGIDWRSV